MLEILRIKEKKLCTDRITLILCVVLISTLFVNVNTQATKEEVDLIASLNSYTTRFFYLYRGLPLPGLIFHLLCRMSSYFYPYSSGLILRDIRRIYFFLFMFTISGILRLSQEIHGRTTSQAFCFSCIFRLFPILQSAFPPDSILALLFIIISLIQLRKGMNIAAAVFIGLSVSSNWASLSIYPPLIVLYVIDMFFLLIDPVKKIQSLFLVTIKNFLIFVGIPIIIYLASFRIHYYIQEYSFEDLSDFSIEFRSTLKSTVENPADKYLMDRSTVTILNQKHRSYLCIKEGTVSCSNEKSNNSTWMIVKIYPDKPRDSKINEEDRYIKHEDFVKIVELNSGMCLRIHNDDSDDKFRDVFGFAQKHENVDDADIWQVLGDEHIIARTSLVRFRHYQTEMEMCVKELRMEDEENSETRITVEDYRKEKLQKVVCGSSYSEKRSRLFYIDDNQNHAFFKKRFSDGRPSETVLKFPHKNFAGKIFEHHAILWNMLETYSAFHSKISPMYFLFELCRDLSSNSPFEVFSSIFAISLPILIISSHIYYKRLGGCTKMKGDLMFACIMYFCTDTITRIFCIGNVLTISIRMWVAFCFASIAGDQHVFLLFSTSTFTN